MYKGQEVKEKVRIAHNELVERNFMTKLLIFPEQLQNLIKTADLLAKGENILGNIFDILTRSMINQFSWAADISKLYNMHYLDYTALPFSLFLYHNLMD